MLFLIFVRWGKKYIIVTKLLMLGTDLLRDCCISITPGNVIPSARKELLEMALGLNWESPHSVRDCRCLIFRSSSGVSLRIFIQSYVFINISACRSREGGKPFFGAIPRFDCKIVSRLRGNATISKQFDTIS